MTSLTALDRLRRLLAVIPWVVEKDGPLIDEIVERFDYRRSELLEDLEHVLFFVGVHPFTPDYLIDVIVAEERVWIRYADWFRRPMRLGAAEKAALYAAGRSVAAITDDGGAGSTGASPDEVGWQHGLGGQPGRRGASRTGVHRDH